MGKCLQDGCWESQSDSPACSYPTINTTMSLAVLLPLLHSLSVPEALSPAHSTGRSWQAQAGAGTRKQFIGGHQETIYFPVEADRNQGHDPRAGGERQC